MLLLNFFKKKNENNVGYSKTLPPELIRPIVLHLKNNKRSLHSCLLVSRDFCKETVDLLWRQPFHFLYTCNNNPKSNNQCHCSKDKRRYQATNLLMTYLLIKRDKEFIKKGIIKAEGESITFNYLELLCVLDLRELYFTIQDWNQWNNKSKKSSPLTVESIMRYFFRNTPKLETFSYDTKFILYKVNNKNPCLFLTKEKHTYLDYYADVDQWCYNYIFRLLIKELKIPETAQFFVNLTELIFTSREVKNQIFSILSQICHNIQKLIIGSIYEDSPLTSLIRSQHNLVHFELFDFPETGINKILESLKESQHNSLKTLILNDVRIDYNSTILSYLKYLQNLQELRFNKCIYNKVNFIYNKNNKIDIFDEEKNYEEGLWLPNLKYLQVDYVDEKKEEFKELSLILSSILIRYSPLII